MLQGHVYVNVDEKEIPTGIMAPEERKLIQNGRQRVSTEYWGMYGSLGYDWVDGPAPVPRSLPEDSRHRAPAPRSVPDTWSRPAPIPRSVPENWAYSAPRDGSRHPKDDGYYGNNAAPVLRSHWEGNGAARVNSQYYRCNDYDRRNDYDRELLEPGFLKRQL